MAENFKSGDVVRLKSGGPTMTIVGSPGVGLAVAWFDGNTLMRHTTGNDLFPPEALERAEPAKRRR